MTALSVAREWGWLWPIHREVAADVHARHRKDWYDLPLEDAADLARMMLNTPGTYTHSMHVLPYVGTMPVAAPVAALAPSPPPLPEPPKRLAMAEHTSTPGQNPSEWTDKWKELARLNGVEID